MLLPVTSIDSVESPLANRLLYQSPQEKLMSSGTAARIKVIDPLLSLSPSDPARLLSRSNTYLNVLVSRAIFAGSMVHLRLSEGIAFGRVRRCMASGDEFEIAVEVTQRMQADS